MPDFSTYAWNQLSPATSPSARWGHRMVWDGTRILMFGGMENRSFGNICNDTWEFDGSDWTDLSPSTTPSARFNHSMVWDGSRVLMFGGFEEGTGFVNDLWEFTAGDWNELSPTGTPPEARFLHLAAWDGSRMLVYGGQKSGQFMLKDTWKLESGAWTQLTPTNYIIRITGGGSTPSITNGRAGMRAVWDGARVLVFSGYSDGGGGGEFQTHPYYESGGGTWQYASSDWTQVGPATNPMARWGQGFCITDDDDKVLMFGGNVSSVGGFGNFHNAETWEFDTDWTQLLVSGPSAREGEMIWDDANARALLFGGRVGSGSSEDVTDETWEFATTVEPADPVKAINHAFGLG